MEKALGENQPREQTVFRKDYSATDHLQTNNQLIEKGTDFNRPFCIGCIDHENAFGSIEHEAIFKAVRIIDMN